MSTQMTMNCELEQLAIEWMLEDDEPQPQKIKVTQCLRRSIEKLRSIITKKAPRIISRLEQLLSMPSIMDEYNSKIDSVNNIKTRLDSSVKLVSYLNKRALYETYELIIDFAKEHMTSESLSKDEERIVFFLSENVLSKLMELNQISGHRNAYSKLMSLCELGLLRALPDSQIREDALKKAYEYKEKLEESMNKLRKHPIEFNRCNFYELINLTESVIAKAEEVIDLYKTCAVRQKGMDINRRCNILGKEVVTESVNVQTTVNNDKQDRIKRKINETSVQLLIDKGYYTELELRRAYNKKDRHITKAQAEKHVLNIIPALIREQHIKRIRVNKESRKKYSIPDKIKSGNYIYVSA